MKKMREAIRWMSEQPMVKGQEIRDLLVREILAGNSMDHYANDGVVAGLLRAYDAAVEERLDAEGKEVDQLPFDRAEALLNKEYRAGYKDCTGFEAVEVGEWPDCLPCQSYFSGIVKEIGYALGYMDGRRMLAMRTYMQERACTAEKI